MKDFPWYKHYPEGVAKEIQLYEYSSLVDLLDKSLIKYRDRVAFENMGVQLTYGQLDKLSANFAAYLQQELGLKKGERIAIQMPNLLQFPVAFIGALRAGLSVVNTNPLYTPRKWSISSRMPEYLPWSLSRTLRTILQKFRSHTSIKHIIVTELGDMLGGLKGAMVKLRCQECKEDGPRV
jgi:long-chain acyl-CoA synthetase